MYYGETRFPKLIKWIVVVNVTMWVLQSIPALGSHVTNTFGLYPDLAIRGQIWRFFTYGFLHQPVSPFHILFNMFGLWFFGLALINRFGERKMLAFYLTSILFCGIVSLFYLFSGHVSLIVGASGGVIALAILYAINFPHEEIWFWGLFPIKARIIALIYIVTTIVGAMNSAGETAYLTHLGGIIFAFLWFWLEPKVAQIKLSSFFTKRNKKTVIHYFEPRKSRQELIAEKLELDDVLKKISDTGMSSLSENEYKILEKASGKPVPRS